MLHVSARHARHPASNPVLQSVRTPQPPTAPLIPAPHLPTHHPEHLPLALSPLPYRHPLDMTATTAPSDKPDIALRMTRNTSLRLPMELCHVIQ